MAEIRLGCVEWLGYSNFCEDVQNFCLDCFDEQFFGFDFEIMRYSFEVGLGPLFKETNVSLHRYDIFGLPLNSTNVDGAWTGMIGAMINGTIDMTIPSLTVTSKRFSKLNFPFPACNYDQDAFMVNPIPKKQLSQSLINVFGLETWIIGLLSLFVLSLTMVLVDYVCNSQEVCRFKAPTFGSYTFASSIKTCRKLFSTLCNVMFRVLFQKRLIHLWSSAQKMLLLTIWSTCAVLGLRVFKSMYVKGLTPEIDQAPFDSIETLANLLKEQKYTLVVNIKDIYMLHIEPESPNHYWAPIRESLIFQQPFYVQNHTAALQYIKKTKGTVYVTTLMRASKIVKNPEFAHLMNVVDRVNPQSFMYAIATRKRFKYFQAFRTGYLNILENGLIHKLHRKYGYLQDVTSMQFDSYDLKSLTTFQIMEALRLLLYGMIISVFTFLLEFRDKIKMSQIIRK